MTLALRRLEKFNANHVPAGTPAGGEFASRVTPVTGIGPASRKDVRKEDVEKYDANEPRDDHGRWTTGGGADHVMGREHTASGDLITRMYEAAKSGGFTYDPRTGATPPDGYVSGIGTAHTFSTPVEKFTVNDVKAFWAKNAELFKQKSMYVGGWLDNGTVWLDPVRRFPASPAGRRSAIALGRKANQISVTDLGKIAAGDFEHAFIPTGGTGKAAAEPRVASGMPHLMLWSASARPEDVFDDITGHHTRSFAKFNPNHLPAGSPQGGEFASGTGGSTSLSGYSKHARIVDGVIQTNSVNDALRALHQNRDVELLQKDEVATLIHRLATAAGKMISAGKQAENLNLCHVSVAGTNLFCAQNKGIPRAQMPQFDGGQMKKFEKYLTKRGYSITNDTELASHLRATQNELNGSKVARIAEEMKAGTFVSPRIMVSKDNYVLDGHHRWAAEVGLTSHGKLGGMKMPVARVNIGITRLLRAAQKFGAKTEASNNIVKDAPGMGDVSVPVPLGSGPKRRRGRVAGRPRGRRYTIGPILQPVIDSLRKNLDYVPHALVKADEEERLVVGWASVLTNPDGSTLVDLQGDIIDEHELVLAAHGFMSGSRTLGKQHQILDGIGTVEEHFVMTAQAKLDLGMPPSVPVGWLIAARVWDDPTWAGVKAGEFQGFSMGGTAVHVELGGP